MTARLLQQPAALVCSGVLLVAIAEFGQVWYYPPPEAGVEFTRAFGGAFRMALWLSASACILWHVLRRGLYPSVHALGPFFPFVFWGAAVIAFWSIDRTAGLRTLTFWMLATCLAVAAACETEPRTLARGVALTFLGVVAASLALGLFSPETATTIYGDIPVVRGLFPHKNAFGWFCALGLVWTAGSRRALGPVFAAAVALTMVGGLLASGSKTAAAVLPAVGVYALALGCCRRAFPDGARGAIALLILVTVTAVLTAVFAPVLIDTIGRDATLTGRTDVWRHYLAYLHDRPLTGYGTGILSSDTEINRAIGGAVPGYEAERLRSPHSLYIGLASEIGLVGIACFLGAHVWVALIAPYRSFEPWSRTAGALAVAILLAGITEMRDGFLPGTATVLLIAARTMSFRERG